MRNVKKTVRPVYNSRPTNIASAKRGRGKTHTLTGSNCEDGIVQRTFDTLFDAVAEPKDRDYMLRMSYDSLSTYQEQDLREKLAESTKKADTIVSALRDEFRQLKTELAAAHKRAEDLEISKASELTVVEDKFRVRCSKSMEYTEEELQQLRKDNTDLAARITILLLEQTLSTGGGAVPDSNMDVDYTSSLGFDPVAIAAREIQ
ncbi:hypothetical protein Q1695_000417 [Nippostrongylus brasiliensis]|nr:hypothetical protein Q1695_000417 [Nippostrongylus brasiliensis]